MRGFFGKKPGPKVRSEKRAVLLLFLLFFIQAFFVGKRAGFGDIKAMKICV